MLLVILMEFPLNSALLFFPVFRNTGEPPCMIKGETSSLIASCCSIKHFYSKNVLRDDKNPQP